MKKLLSFAAALLLFALAACLALIAAGLFPYTPFAVKTWDTSLFARTDADAGALKVARYDIDFIASFASGKNRYVALYPFVVEAEIDLSRAVQKKAGTASGRDGREARDGGSGPETLVCVPFPEYRAHLQTDGVQVFMETLPLDYKSALMPVLETFREKSRDYALADAAFTAQCLLKAEEYIEGIFGPVRIEWEQETDAIERIRAPQVPIDIEASKSALVAVQDAASLRDAFDARISRSDPGIATHIRFGIAGRETGTLDTFADSFKSDEHIVFRYHNPVDPSAATFVSYADEGYRRAFSFASRPDAYYYIELTQSEAGTTEEDHLRTAAPDLLYLAASIAPASRIAPELGSAATEPDTAAYLRYTEYAARYDEALSEIRTNRYGQRLKNALDELDRLARERTGEPSADAALMREIAGFKTEGEGPGFAGGPGFATIAECHGKVAELAALLRYPDFTRMDALFRSEAENRYRSDTEVSGNLEAFFWMMRKELRLTEEEAERYKTDMIESGDTLSSTLVRSLDAHERNTLFARYIEKRLPADIPFERIHPDDGTDETWLFFGQAALDWKNKKSFPTIADKLAGRGCDRSPGNLVLLFADPIGKAGFFTDYHALVFGESSIALYEGLTDIIPRYAKEALYAELLFADGSFTIGKRTISGRSDLASILEGFAAAYTSEFYNRDRALELVSENLKTEALRTLARSKRPAPAASDSR